MSKIYTKTGDLGSTSLVDGSRLSKDDLRIEAYGTVDELNAWIGLLASATENQNRLESLQNIQNILFEIGSNLACPVGEIPSYIPKISEDDIALLERQIDEFEKSLSPLKAFVLPGGNEINAQTHIARTVCRRAEREVIKLNHKERVDALIIKYLNRLSDFLFVLSRIITFETKSIEIYWKGRNKN